jgi:hypothetical protein
LVCVNKIFDDCTGRRMAGNFQAFLDFFLHFGSRHLCNKNSETMSAICIHFYRLIACVMSDNIKCLTVECLTNCLLLQSIFLKIVCSMPAYSMEK